MKKNFALSFVLSMTSVLLVASNASASMVCTGVGTINGSRLQPTRMIIDETHTFATIAFGGKKMSFRIEALPNAARSFQLTSSKGEILCSTNASPCTSPDTVFQYGSRVTVGSFAPHSMQLEFNCPDQI